MNFLNDVDNISYLIVRTVPKQIFVSENNLGLIGRIYPFFMEEVNKK